MPQKKEAARLDAYRRKRESHPTPEPGPKVGRRMGRSFVVQEHHARSHHFDFRLEIDGVLVSWAVPKGIPDDLSAKRLAVHVEDHPLAYGQFEGVIPKGSYGAGTVAIWDKGEWEPLGKDWRKAFTAGKLKFTLKGRRLDGVYVLIRMGDEPNWMMRMLQAGLPEPSSTQSHSEEVGFVSPQFARPGSVVPSGSEWIHEIKFDGYRIIAVQKSGSLTLFTRSGLDWTGRFKVLARHLGELTSSDFVLDGEAVVFDDKGRSRFGRLQEALQNARGSEITFMAFDLLHFQGLNLRDQPLAKRLERLAEVVPEESGPVRRSKVWPAEAGKDLFRQACQNGLEGIVSKKANGRYRAQSRRDWVKSKCHARQEFVVCGYTAPKGSLPGFGALVLASWENGELVSRGKVGSGFSDKDRVQLLEIFRPLRRKQATLPLEEKSVVWLKPLLVAEVKFSEITREGSIRQGSFVAMREDKSPTEVHLDAPEDASSSGKAPIVMGITISHPDRLVYPGEGVTKKDVAYYYERVGQMMLPFVANRPLALLRAPTGITGELFFQKSFTSHVPLNVEQRELGDGSRVITVKNTRGLISLAQFGTIEFHPWGASLQNVEKPDFLTWDLDPDAAVPWKEVLGAALLLRDYLADLGLSTVVKTSGGKGLHVMLYLKRLQEWSLLAAFAKAVASAVSAFNPRRLTPISRKSVRTGKIYIDWMRNTRGATCIAPWALRARPGAPVSMPVNWSQLPQISPSAFTIHQPPQTPSEWRELKPQSVTKPVLRQLGAL